MIPRNKSDDVNLYEVEKPHYEPVMRDAPPRYVEQPDGSYRRTSPPTGRAVVSCVGDMLAEAKLYRSHCINGQTDFHDIFQFVRPVFAASDLTIGNLETMICTGAPYTGEQHKVDGKYHNNAPVEFLAAIRDAGFDFLMLSNNHNIDCGVAGIRETLARIDAAEMMHTGLFPHADARRCAVVDVNGIRLGLLAYSTWFNRNQDRLTELGRETVINEYTPEKAAADIAAAKAAGAEFVLVYIHWGVDAEYKSEPSASMRRVAQELADSGADYIVGSHTHSIQPHDLVTARDGRIVPVVYSMGNFVTSEISPISRSTGILRLTLVKDGTAVRVADEEFIPCYIPDQAFGLSYPVLTEKNIGGETMSPAVTEGEAMRITEGLGTVLKKTAALFNANHNMTGNWMLTKQNICCVLGLPAPEKDELYTKLSFAEDAQRDGAAIISRITSDKGYKTPRKDFEKLADTAIKRGAKLLISTEQIGSYPCLIVDDVFQAYAAIIQACRASFTPKTVSITGSIGKTTATEIIYTVLSSKYNTHRNTGSANNFRYCGSVVQGLKKEHEVYVQELMEGPPYGAAASIAQLVRPDIAVMTLVGTSHMEAFGSQERIWESCLGVQEGMPEDGVLVLNGDDPFQRDTHGTTRKVIYYGIKDEHADYRAVNIRNGENGISFDVLHDGTQTPVTLRCFGEHNVLYALAAFAVGRQIGMTVKEIVDGIARYRTSGIRQNLVSYRNIRLYLDCYNASVESMKSALETVAAIPKKGEGRRIAVLADIKEGGESAAEYHHQVGRTVAGLDYDAVFCYGENSRYIAQEARANPSLKVFCTETKDGLIDQLRGYIREEDLLLFKGSHSMELEHVVDKLFGTWLHEEFERYDFKTRTVDTPDLRFCVYTDHASVVAKRSTVSDVVIPDCIDGVPVESIGVSVFNRSKYTRSVVLPDTLVNIRYCAFYKANNLKTIKIPGSVRIIDTSAFSTCENLETVEIAPGCTHLGYRAFGNCKNLREITIPATVRQIGGECFVNCSKLTIRGEPGSYAEKYAAAHKIPFARRNKLWKKAWRIK